MARKHSAPPPNIIVEQLIKGTNGTPAPHLANAQTALALDRAWRQKGDDKRLLLGWDEFSNAIVLLSTPPWKEHYKGEAFTKPKIWDEVDDARACMWLASTYGIKVSEKTTYSAVLTTAHQNSWHPVKEYLEAAEKVYLDAQGARMDRLLADYFGCEHTEYHRDISRFFMLGAVGRIYEPGCQVDLVPIAEGRQGGRKSSAMRALCPDPEWFYDSDLELGNKDAYQAIRGRWLIELPELDSLSRTDEKKIKAFFTSRLDTYRPSYGRRHIQVPRQCVFVGTTNQGKDHPYLRDETGGRRFAGFEVGEIKVDEIERDRDLLWGEAVHRYKNGWQWYTKDPEAMARFKDEQEARYKVDPWEDQFTQWYDLQTSKPTRLTILEVLGAVFKLDLNQMGEASQKQAAKALKRAGWLRRKISIKGVQKWFYVHPSFNPDDPNAERPTHLDKPTPPQRGFGYHPDEEESPF